jgi:hypothetical protein
MHLHRPCFAVLVLAIGSPNYWAAPPDKTETDKTSIEPERLKGVNTPGDEDDPFFVSDTEVKDGKYDGPRLFYVSRNSEKEKDAKYHIMVSRRKGGDWTKGHLLDGINGEGEELSPFLMREETAVRGKPNYQLFFASSRLGGNFDLFRAMHTGKDSFLEPAPIANDGVSTEADELYPWLTDKGKYLYFSRKTKEGMQIFVSFRPGGNGAFEAPHKVDLPVKYCHATLTEDGKTMFLQGPVDNKDRWGIYRATRDTGKKNPWDDGAWKDLKALKGLNTSNGQKGDLSPCLAKDGPYFFLYFASDRPGGAGGLDLYRVNTKSLGD